MDGIERGYLDVDSSIYIWMLDRSPNRRYAPLAHHALLAYDYYPPIFRITI